jgi:hypothetical protein
MAKSYIAIASRGGLISLVSEDGPLSTVLPESLRQGSATTASACWAVLDDEAAASVVRCLRLREPEAALEILLSRAEHLGAWLPNPEYLAANPQSA